MTPSEFKAWFDGFTEAFAGCPTKAQWARIKTRVAEIDGKSVTERVYVDRYWPYVSRPIYWGAATCGSVTTYTSNAVGQAQAANNLSQLGQNYQAAASSFNSLGAMGDLGRAEAKSLAS